MKIIKKPYSLIALLLLLATFNSRSMEPKPSKWAAHAGTAIIGGYAAFKQFLSYIHGEPTEPFPFTELPKEIQNEIIVLLLAEATATSLKEAAFTINSLVQVNHELNELINDPQYCLKLIKHLAKEFNCSDEEVAEALQTQEAKNRLLLTAVRKNDCPMIKKFLNKGADINNVVFSGELTLLMYAVILNFFDAVQCLLNNPNIAINQQQASNRDTALLMALNKINKSIPIIKLLLDAGADPELANYEGLTPLAVAQQTDNQEIIDLIQEAIDRKHEKESYAYDYT